MKIVAACCTLLTFALLPSPVRGRDPSGGSVLSCKEMLFEDLAGPRSGVGRGEQITRADTTWYGDYQLVGGEYYARSSSRKADVMWTFDRGNGPDAEHALPNAIINGEGWLAKDLTANDVNYFRVIDNTLNLGQGVPPPIIAGSKSLWIGADKPQADGLCWACGPGYGNNWCNRVVSEPLAYNGSGAVTLNFKYFNKSEPCYDGTQVYLRRADTTELLLNPTPTGGCPGNPDFENKGGFTDSIGFYLHPAIYDRVVTEGEIGTAQTIKFILEFESDVGYSDEDCSYTTTWGPFGCDDMTVNGGGINKTYNFETGLQGWTLSFCNPVGLFVDIVDVGCYTILDPCTCKLEGNVVAMHADVCDNGVHPDGQHVWIESPICDFGNSNPKTIFMDVDGYADLPQENGVLWRPGWKYYPFTCDITGLTGWSPRVGVDAYWYYSGGPACGTAHCGGTTLSLEGIPVPADAQKVIAIIELLASCSTFAITNCTGITNFSPLLDNITVAQTLPTVDAPQVSAVVGFEDVGSSPSSLFDPRASGPANTGLRIGGEGRPVYCGDSLVVTGPQPGSDPNHRWEARLWWRVARRAPLQSDRAGGQDTRYKIWRDRVADGKKIDRPYKPEFTFGWMDSVQVGPVVLRNSFQSTFREDDDDFVGEGNPENDMIWDDVLFPGSRIEYFLTSNYVRTPNIRFYLPDTTGGNFYEFEILPGMRTARIPNCGGQGGSYCVYYPATLYINAWGTFYVENALRTILNGYPPCMEEDECPIPPERNWDRFDYLGAGSNYTVPFARGAMAGSNNGMTLNQILGYRQILLGLGGSGAGAVRNEDFALFGQWLASPLCGANTNRQVFIANGNKVGEVFDFWPNGHTFLNNVLGATLLCDAFNGISQDPDCQPEEDAFCVRYLPITGGPFDTEMDVDAWGNFCPYRFGFNVYSTYGTGVGNRYYSADGGAKQMQYAQVVNENLGPDANWRTVLDGVAWAFMTGRDPAGSGQGLCPQDTPSIVAGVISELGAALKWGFGVTSYDGIPKLASAQEMASCQGTWTFPAEAADTGAGILINRLYPTEPNPFNPRTTIRFATARTGPVEILIHDVAGRLVRKLVSGSMTAGNHSVVWDGTNEAGAKVGSGVYWARMKAGSFVSTRKMVVLK